MHGGGCGVIYLVIGVTLGSPWRLTKSTKPAPDAGQTSIVSCFKLLGNPIVLLCFLGIIAHVGIDVGINAQAPRILMEHTAVPLATAAGATSVYFAFRTIGTGLGGIVLQN